MVTLVVGFCVAEASAWAAVDFDTDLRARLRTFVASDEYQRAATAGDIQSRLGRLMQITIREHQAELPALIKKDLKVLPKLATSKLPEVVSTNAPGFFSVSGVAEVARDQAPASGEGAAYYCAFFLPSRAALQGLQAFLAREIGPAAFGKRSVVAQLAAPKLFCLSDDPQNPVIAVDAPDGLFIVELTGAGDGLFVPSRVLQRKPMAEPPGNAQRQP